jgi:hypothetical protein
VECCEEVAAGRDSRFARLRMWPGIEGRITRHGSMRCLLCQYDLFIGNSNKGSLRDRDVITDSNEISRSNGDGRRDSNTSGAGCDEWLERGGRGDLAVRTDRGGADRKDADWKPALRGLRRKVCGKTRWPGGARPPLKIRSLEEGGGVVLGPGAEGVGGAAEEIGDGGRDVCRLAEGGRPGVEEHVEDWERECRDEDFAGFFGGEVFVAKRAMDCVGDELELLELGEGFGAGDDVVLGGVGLRLRSGEDVSGYGGDVARVDGSGGSLEERPANGFVVAEGWAPPIDAVVGEDAGAEEGVLERS